MPLYTDARHYAKAGVPIVLYGAGPHTIEEANAHRADERLPLAELYKATEVIALTLAELMRGSRIRSCDRLVLVYISMVCTIYTA